MLHLIDITLQIPVIGVDHTDLIGIVDRNIELGVLLRPAQVQYLSGEGEALDDLETFCVKDLDGREVLSAKGDREILLVRTKRGEDRQSFHWYIFDEVELFVVDQHLVVSDSRDEGLVIRK